MLSAKEIIDEIRDRIYCQCESNGSAKEAIEKIMDKFKNFLYQDNYDIENDLDNENNNILHLIAKSGLSDFYDIIKKHPNFDNIKNVKNKNGFTPYDIAKSYPFFIKYLISKLSNNPVFCVPILVTQHYYFESTFELIEKMKNDCLNDSFNYNNIKEYLKLYFNFEISKAKNTSEENKKLLELAMKIIIYLPNEIFMHYDINIHNHKNLNKIIEKTIIDSSLENFVEKQKILLADNNDSDSDGDNIIQDYE